MAMMHGISTAPRAAPRRACFVRPGNPGTMTLRGAGFGPASAPSSLPLAAALAACVLAPLGAVAQTVAVSMTFTVPRGWQQSTGILPGHVYFVRDGDKVHSLVVRSLPKTYDAQTYSAEQMDAERARGADVIDEGTVQVCDGEAAHRWTVHSASTGTSVESHFLTVPVTGGVAVVSYTHQLGVGDRRDALDAMTSVCPGPFPNPVPAGWSAPRNRYAATLAVESPDATSTFIASYSVLGAARFDAFERANAPRGTILADRREPCGDASVHRLDVQLGGQIAEAALAFLHGTAYRYVYTRPAKHDPDRAAERALTAFCRANAPLPSSSSEPVML
jgi:hypothetical protein